MTTDKDYIFLDSPERKATIHKLHLLNLVDLYVSSDDYSKLLRYLGDNKVLKIPDIYLELLDDAFNDNQFLRVVELNKHLRKVGYRCFKDCKHLEKVEFNENLTEIAVFAFRDTNIKEIVTNKNLKIINDYAFADCYNLSKVELNEGLEEIRNGVFISTIIKELTIPETVKKIGTNLFNAVPLEDIYILSEHIDLDKAYKAVEGTLALPNKKLKMHFKKSRERDISIAYNKLLNNVLENPLSIKTRESIERLEILFDISDKQSLLEVTE